MQIHQPLQHAPDRHQVFHTPTPAPQQAPRRIPQPLPPAALLQRAAANPEPLTRAEALYLQRTLGNRAVRELLRGGGGRRIQPRLTLGPAGDSYEQEAERVARHVVQQLSTSPPQPAGQTVQRQQEEEALQGQSATGTTEGGRAVSPDMEAAIQQAHSRGQPLPDAVRRPMEQAFGTDFSSVRVHTDTPADQLNRSIQARAFTTGQDIFIRQGEYHPGSAHGQALLAHELTHVVQQNGMTLQRPVSDLPLPHPSASAMTRTNGEAVLLDQEAVNRRIPGTQRSTHGGLVRQQTLLRNVPTISMTGARVIQREPLTKENLNSKASNLAQVKHISPEAALKILTPHIGKDHRSPEVTEAIVAYLMDQKITPDNVSRLGEAVAPYFKLKSHEVTKTFRGKIGHQARNAQDTLEAMLKQQRTKKLNIIYDKLELYWTKGAKTTGYNQLIKVDVARQSNIQKTDVYVHLTKLLEGDEDNTQIDLAEWPTIKKYLTTGLHLTVEEYPYDRKNPQGNPKNPRCFYKLTNNSWEMNWGTGSPEITKTSKASIQKILQETGNYWLNDWKLQIKQWADAGGI